MSSASKPPLDVAPLMWLCAGAVLGLGSFLLALHGDSDWAAATAAACAICAIWLTYLVARSQSAQAESHHETVQGIRDAVDEMNSWLRQQKEQVSVTEYGIADDSDPEPAEDKDRPSYADQALEALNARGAKLERDDVVWKRKIPFPPRPGNHGWFVEAASGNASGRWYVRKARGLTTRKAMPRDFLDALEKEQGVDPQTIVLDFQLKEHGLASWYARTSDGKLWRVWRPARTWSAGINTELVEEELTSG